MFNAVDQGSNKLSQKSKLVLTLAATSVITRFWPNQGVGRKGDGLGRLHVEDL
jgi:hypothetical protein